jgi:hypothetical protein
VGVYGGFLRRYELFRQEKSAASVEKVKVGEVLSIPVIGFVEGHYRGLFYEFGLGPYITRFNYVRIDLPEFSVMSIFGYLFGAGYEKSFGRGLAVQLKGELLVNAPIDVVEFLDPVLKNETAGSRFTEYNRNDYPTIMYNATISCGLQYDFGKKIRLPLEEAVTAVANSGFGARVRRLFGR